MTGLSKLAATLSVGTGLAVLAQNHARGANGIKPEPVPVPVQRIAGLSHPIAVYSNWSAYDGFLPQFMDTLQLCSTNQPMANRCGLRAGRRQTAGAWARSCKSTCLRKTARCR